MEEKDRDRVLEIDLIIKLTESTRMTRSAGEIDAYRSFLELRRTTPILMMNF